MTDDGLRFYATIETAAGEQLHRETPDRDELIATHVGQPGTVAADRGRVVRVSMEATTAAAIRNMLAAILFGARQKAERDAGR